MPNSEPEWKIFYGDGSTYSDLDGSAEDAPADNVQVIVVRQPEVGHVRIFGNDFYYMLRGEWQNSDEYGMWDQANLAGHVGFAERDDGTTAFVLPGNKIVDKLNAIFFLKRIGWLKTGRVLTQAEWRAVLKRAELDEEIPSKSAYLVAERRR